MSARTLSNSLLQLSMFNDDYLNIGDIEFIKRKGSKKLSITVKPFKNVRVGLPYRFSFDEAKTFVKEQLDWIIEAKKKAELIEEKKSFFSEDIDYRTREHQLELIASSLSTVSSFILGDKLKVYYPEKFGLKNDKTQEQIKEAVIKVLRREARRYLPNRVEELARRHNLSYSKLSIKKTISRWGSCSHDNNINLSIFLMRLPEELIDYVILHELTHTIHKNHGKYFWWQLESLLPGARKLDKELNNYSCSVL